MHRVDDGFLKILIKLFFFKGNWGSILTLRTGPFVDVLLDATLSTNVLAPMKSRN